MQNPLRIRLLSFFVLSLLFFSCQQDDLSFEDTTLGYIPEEITMLTVVNVDQMMEKADFESLKDMAFYQNVVSRIEKDNAAFAKVLEEPRPLRN